MAWGTKIVRADGSVWMSPDFTPLNLINRSVISGAAGTVFQSSIPAGNECLFFVRYSADGVAAFAEINQNGFRALRTERAQGTGNIAVYAFGDIAPCAPKYGIFMFNASGRLIYHMNMKPLELFQVKINPATPTVSTGVPCAVSPAFTGRTTQFNSSVGGFDVFSHYAGAYGNVVTNRRIQTGRGSGPGGFIYSTSALYIRTENYD